MAEWLLPHWHDMLIPSKPLPEIVLRGTLVYLFLFGILRAVLHRQAGGVSITDMLLVVLIADASQNAMAAEYRSIPDGILLVATLVCWNYALDWLSFRFPRLRHLVHPVPLKLMQNGRFLRRNMRRELITEDELRTELRKQGGGEDHHEVREAFMEGDGHISVIKRPPSAGEENSKSNGQKRR